MGPPSARSVKEGMNCNAQTSSRKIRSGPLQPPAARGACWERHCTDNLKPTGFEPAKD